jgi:hypothetical protein
MLTQSENYGLCQKKTKAEQKKKTLRELTHLKH